MALSIRTATRDSRVSVINSDLGASARIKFYSGPIPATVNDAPTGDLLADCTCNTSGFGSTNGSGVLTANPVTDETYVARDDNANNTGTISFCRIANSAGTDILQFSTVGTTGGPEEVILPSLDVTIGEAVEVNSVTITEGNI